MRGPPLPNLGWPNISPNGTWAWGFHGNYPPPQWHGAPCVHKYVALGHFLVHPYMVHPMAKAKIGAMRNGRMHNGGQQTWNQNVGKRLVGQSGMETIFAQNLSTTCDNKNATTWIVGKKTNKDHD